MIFELYKYKCILKQKRIQLPEFSREIKLSFHLDQLTTPPTQQQPPVIQLFRTQQYFNCKQSK